MKRNSSLSKNTLTQTLKPRRRDRLRLMALGAAAIVICAVLFSPGWLVADLGLTSAQGQKSEKQMPSNEAPVSSTRIQPASVSVVNFKQLAEKEAANSARSASSNSAEELHSAPAPMSIQEVSEDNANSPASADSAAPQDSGGPLVPSPAPSQSFLAQEDAAKVGTGTFTIPPDTMGAVGLDKVFVNVNNNYRVQNKATGVALSTVSIDTFWAASGATGVFDPRVQYDSIQNRWLVSAVSNAQTANSSVLVGISNTSDPQGTYTLFRFIVGCAPGAAGCNAQGEWADFPMLGFNKNWIAVGWNQFTINTSAFVAGKMLVLDYPTARTGTANGTLFTNTSAATGFCMHPVTTFSSTENTLYVPTHQQSGGALYRLHTITSTPSAPVFTLDGTARVRPGGGWTQPGGDNLPQQCIPGVSLPTHTCPATPRGIDALDAFIRSNAVFRNGKIWYAQSIALPAGGITVASRFAAQWTALNTDGTFSDGGRVEDPTAQIFNGGKHYSFPSISVNKNNDVLLGFSEFESDDYVDAGYTYRQNTDAAGTMRDPVIYKEGEDYYSKTFSGTRNRWGDYSHTVVDPSNDRDLWTIQEYAQARVGVTGQGSNDSRWGTWWAKVEAPAGSGELIISEFRLHGPNGPAGTPAPEPNNDEYIEIYNASGSALTVTTADGSAGYAVAASDGVIRCTIPNGTVIPSRGHYLCVNSAGYSLASYPAGSGTTATGDATYTTNIPNNVGIALFNTATPANFSTGTRLDAVGSTAEANTLYKEGAGYPATTQFLIEHALYRDMCARVSTTCTIGTPKDTNANAADFLFVDTNGTSAGAGQRLGAPGPENLSSPIFTPAAATLVPLDSTQPSGYLGGSNTRNFVRDSTSDPANNSTFGTVSLRRRLANNSGESITRLRFRVIDLSTFPALVGTSDLRVRTSGAVVVTGVNDPATCMPLPVPCAVTVQGTTLEQPPNQPNGGGFNSSLSAGTVTLAAPILTGTSANFQFLLGIQQTGLLRFAILTEGLTTSGRGVAAGVDYYSGSTEPGTPTAAPAIISGSVTTADGQPVAGVTMRLSGIRPAKVITDSFGHYSFRNVDAEQFYTVTPARVNYNFNPGSRSFSLLGDKTDAVFTAIPDAVIVGNAIDTPEYFVRQHYLDFLNREPDEAGFSFWSDQIASCGNDTGCVERKRINVSAAYFLSIEFQNTGGLVDGLYRASFGRGPLYAEFMPDTQALAQGVVVGDGDWSGRLAANKRAFADAFVNRAAFRDAYDGLSNARYVDRLINQAQISFSDSERNELVNGLATGATTRAEVLLRIAENDGFVKARRNEAFVMMQYFGYLRRDPDESGLQYWLNKLNSFNGNFEQAEMVKAFLHSSEYRARFAR